MKRRDRERESDTFSKITTIPILRSYFFTHVEIMNYMAVAFQKVRQACRNENSSFPNGSSLRKVETLTDSDNAVENDEWRSKRSSRQNWNGTIGRGEVSMYKRHVRETRFCHRPFSSKLYERNRKGEIGGNSIERSTEYRSAISVMSNQPSESFRKIFTQFLFDYTSRFHFHSFNAITRRARVHLAILLEAEQLVVVEITHVATQPCFYTWLQRELIGV